MVSPLFLPPLLLPLVAVLSFHLSGLPDEDAYTNKEHGFRVQGPSSTWVAREVPAVQGAVLSVSIKASDSPLPIEARVSVIESSGQADPEQRRTQILAYAESTQGISNPESFSYRIGEKEWPAIRVEQESPGNGTFLVQQVFLAQASLLYVLQFHAPKDRFESQAKEMDAIFQSFGFIEVSQERQQGWNLQELASKCGSEIDWAPNWEVAQKRARDENRLVMVYVRSYPGFVMKDEVKAGHFSDLDLMELISEWYVPLHWTPSMNAPFQAQDRYGMGPSTFGNSILVADFRGQVLAETYAPFPVFSLYRFLADATEWAPKTRKEGSPPEDALELGRWHLQRGQTQRALDLLADVDSPEAALLCAIAHRRHLDGKLAFEALEGVEFSDPRQALLADQERAKTLVGLGRMEEAEEILQRHEDRDDDFGVSARYELGLLAFSQNRKDLARAHFQGVIDQNPESRYAWLSASALTNAAFGMDREISLTWPPKEKFDVLEVPPSDPKPSRYAELAVSDAVDYLLETQEENGAWSCPSDVISDPNEPSHLTFAISALCGEALLPYREHEGVQEAIERALDYALRTWKRIETSPPVEFYMTYAVWSDAYVLSFLSGCLNHDIGDRPSLEIAAESIVTDLRRRQKSGGGWSYYLTPDLAKASDPLDISMSFTTAAILLSLHQAGESGISIESSLTDAAVGCLKQSLNTNATFEYSLDHQSPGGPRNLGKPGASGRGPGCALALHRFGEADLDLIRSTLEIFTDSSDRLAKEARKALMHCGVGGLGSHYIMFDYFNCADAISALPAQEQEPYREHLLTRILEARNEDGSYLDNLIIGTAFGAGAALRAFHDLGVEPDSEN